MLKLGIATTLVALAVAPAATAAVPNSNANERATVKVCNNVKAHMGASSFNAVFAQVSRNSRAALRNCARREAAAMQQARVNAAKTCKAERGTTPESRAAFRAKYGGGANAMGRCVSQTARAANQERREAMVNAAQACRTERGTTAESKAAFQTKYGGGRNAFGKCVSTLAKAQND
jgi:hypothetical protein